MMLQDIRQEPARRIGRKDEMKDAEAEKGGAKKASRGKKGKKQISAQLEERWVGSRDETLTRIVAKESEIHNKVNQERRKAERMLEDARGKAAAIRREAVMEEIGKEEYNQVLQEAMRQVEEIRKAADVEVEKIRRKGLKNLDKAVKLVVDSVGMRREAE
jgi:vacuolar-type H+-ATPase subunit H